MLFTKRTTTVQLLLLLNLLCHGQVDGGYRLEKEIIESIEKRIRLGYHPSVAIAYIDSSGVSFFNFGKTSFQGSPVDEHTIYEIGSITKTFTAVLLAKSVRNGDVGLDDPITNYLPDSIEFTTNYSQITLAQLSDHTSSLPRLPDNMNWSNPYNPYADYTIGKLYSFLTKFQPAREPGTQYEYSNLAVGLLGNLLATTKGKRYEALVKEGILNPLKMEETFITLNNEMQQNLAKGHAGGQQVPNWDLPALAGAGALRSSTSDMATYVAENLGFGSTELYPAMQLTHTERHRKGTSGVGLGWHIMEGSKGNVICHNGGTGGYRSFVGFVKETGQGVVVLTNSTEPVDDIGFKILDPTRQLRKVLTAEDAVQVNETVLQSYSGVYKLTPALDITISNEGEQLFAQATGQMRFQVFAENDTSFFYTITPAELLFHIEGDKVKKLTLIQGGQEIIGAKIK